jgi:RimJ/RimL family protein N-acetyltransferase
VLPEFQVTEVPAIPQSLRDQHLSALGEGQELFLEQLVRRGRRFLLTNADRLSGYAVIHDRTVVEYHINAVAPAVIQSGFDAVLERSQVQIVLCQTFDPLLLSALSGRRTRSRIVGRLFRRFREPDLTPTLEINARRGSAKDIPRILAMHDGFFDGIDEIREYLREDGLWVYRTGTAELAGCGAIRRVVPGGIHADIGMIVSETQRRRGLGTRIVSHLRRQCLARGWQPVCGCSVDNHASCRTLEKAGFVTDHALVEHSLIPVE